MAVSGEVTTGGALISAPARVSLTTEGSRPSVQPMSCLMLATALATSLEKSRTMAGLELAVVALKGMLLRVVLLPLEQPLVVQV